MGVWFDCNRNMELGRDKLKNLMLGLLAETFIHSGAGSNEGAIDLPVAREAATDYPYIPGSGMKGALKDSASECEWKNKIFGKQENAGLALVSDARLLLLPVRSLSGSYKWLTCSHLLERLSRDRQRMGLSEIKSIPKVEKGQVITFDPSDKGHKICLEELVFESVYNNSIQAIISAISPLFAHDSTKARLKGQLLLLHDDDFSWFARYALPIQARNQLDEKTKQSNNLWYEESLPPDTLMYSNLGSRGSGDDLQILSTFIKENRYLQAGGNETVGQGWFAVTVHAGEKKDDK